MAYCKKCGAEIPEYAKFCTKCGEPDPIAASQAAPAPDVAQEPTAPAAPTVPQAEPATTVQTEKKAQSFLPWVTKHFWAVYIILGVASYVFSQISSITMLFSFGFGVTMAVFAMLGALTFCEVGIIKFVVPGNRTENGKRTTADIVCFAVGILMLAYVLTVSIVMIMVGHDIMVMLDALTRM